MDFKTFTKIPRLSRECIITEKIDGTNGVIGIDENGALWAGSRNRWLIGPDYINGDNMGFGVWAYAHKDELMKLGPGLHYGEWWGLGIQRGYGLKEKRFSLFNVSRWGDPEIRPACCGVVPILYQGAFDTREIEDVLYQLSKEGSHAAPGFMNPEGVVIYHVAGGFMFKKTLDGDGGKWKEPENG